MNILLTGAIGDVFALESFWTDRQRRSIQTIYYATQRMPILKTLFDALPNYQIEQHVSLWDNWANKHDFTTKVELEDTLGESVPAEDYSIFVKFPEYQKTRLNYSSWLAHTVATIDHLNFPEDFVFIQHSTDFDRRIADRHFDEADWQWLLRFLEDRQLHGVVVGLGADPVPSHPRITNLMNQTTILEGIEVLKLSAGFIGIDSCFSVLAAKLFKTELLVRIRNPHGIRSRLVYFAPHQDASFLVRSLADCPKSAFQM